MGQQGVQASERVELVFRGGKEEMEEIQYASKREICAKLWYQWLPPCGRFGWEHTVLGDDWADRGFMAMYH